MSQTIQSKAAPTSPLVLADQLLTMAKDADQAGLSASAKSLLKLAYKMYAEKPSR